MVDLVLNERPSTSPNYLRSSPLADADRVITLHKDRLLGRRDGSEMLVGLMCVLDLFRLPYMDTWTPGALHICSHLLM